MYVAPEATVAPLVNFLCQEIAAAFKANGAVLPPWRHASSMLSKWLPRKSLDETVAETYTVPTPRTGASQQQVARGSEPGAPAGPNSAAIAAPIAAAAGSRRSLDGPVQGYPLPHPIRSHWMAAAPSLVQQQAILGQLQGSKAPGQQGPELMHFSRARSLVRATAKPISCEPRSRVVGGNFTVITVGNA